MVQIIKGMSVEDEDVLECCGQSLNWADGGGSLLSTCGKCGTLWEIVPTGWKVDSEWGRKAFDGGKP